MLLLLLYAHVVMGLIMIMQMTTHALIETYKGQYCRVALFATLDSNHSMVTVGDLLHTYRVLATNKDMSYSNESKAGDISVAVGKNSLRSTDMKVDGYEPGSKRFQTFETTAKTYSDNGVQHKGIGMHGFISVDANLNRNINTTISINNYSSTSQSSTLKDQAVSHSETNKWSDVISTETNINGEVAGSDKPWNNETTIRSAPKENDISLCERMLIEISSDEGSLIQLVVGFGLDGEAPAVVHSIEQKHDANCSEEGVLIGNDKHRIGIAMPTSYSLCLTQPGSWDEIVSRSPYVWIILPESSNTSLMHIQYTAKQKKVCKTDEFECSPVQCVKRSVICDAQRDCHNGRDEYCDIGNEASDMLTYPACFLCADGLCIRPSLPIYSPDYGRKLWYLCDKLPHCLDATDERRDICMRLKFLKGRENAVHQCLVNNRSVLIWKQNICDGIQHCDKVDGKESTASLCKLDKEKVPDEPIDPLVSLVPVCALLLLAAGTMFMRLYFKRQRKKFGDAAELVTAGQTEDEESTYSFTNIDTCHHRRNNHACISIIAEEDSDNECNEDSKQGVEGPNQPVGSSERCTEDPEACPDDDDANPWRPTGVQIIDKQSENDSSCTPESVEMEVYAFEQYTSV